MKFFVHLAVFLLLTAGAAGGAAEVITIPIGQQGSAGGAIERPERGMSAAGVRTRFGAPQAISAPVGEPPISQWRYEGFTVYFEGETVVHSVLHHVPRHPVN